MDCEISEQQSSHMEPFKTSSEMNLTKSPTCLSTSTSFGSQLTVEGAEGAEETKKVEEERKTEPSRFQGSARDTSPAALHKSACKQAFTFKCNVVKFKVIERFSFCVVLARSQGSFENIVSDSRPRTHTLSTLTSQPRSCKYFISASVRIHDL